MKPRGQAEHVWILLSLRWHESLPAYFPVRKDSVDYKGNDSPERGTGHKATRAFLQRKSPCGGHSGEIWG